MNKTQQNRDILDFSEFILENKDDMSSGEYHSKYLLDDPLVQHHPFLICNYKKNDENNNRLYDRVFPANNLPNLLDPRFQSVSLCDYKMNPSIPKVEDVDNTFTVLEQSKPYNCSVPLTSGRADPNQYFNNIDVESRLKRIDYKDNKCFTKDYKNKDSLKECSRIFDKDYRIPDRSSNADTCGTLQFPKECNIDTLYHLPIDRNCVDMCETIWNNNTSPKLTE